MSPCRRTVTELRDEAVSAFQMVGFYQREAHPLTGRSRDPLLAAADRCRRRATRLLELAAGAA